MKRFAITGAFLLSSLLSITAIAADAPTPEQKAATDIANRQAVFKLLSFSNAPLGGMARGTTPYDAAAAKAAAERIQVLAAMIPELFAADTTGPVSAAAKTRAADTIWASKADFDMLAADLGAGAAAALEILNTQGEAGVKDAVAAIGPKCGACHDRFRLE
ncbi:MAG: cytochrome c [Pseudomonadota bacterium]